MGISKYLTQWKYRINPFKTLYFNFKYLPFKEAIMFPFLIANNVILRCLDGNVLIEAPHKRGMVRIGFRDMGIQNEKDRKTIIDLRSGSSLIFRGKASIGGGARLYTKGVLSIGDDFYLSLNSTIIAHDYVSIGNNVTVGWDSLIMDTDFHKVYNLENMQPYTMTSPITIHDHCWICNSCQILKGSNIPEDSIIASMSLVNKTLSTPPHSLLAGIPVQLKKTGITHKR